ncbi:MAG: helix-turn-helix transcriptional regulator, partial [Clostridia bacterium]|nr:helix-turn-helix transcriptional regulator [Clostridia bacterium]
MTIGESIRKMRRARDITQEDLAELLHITPQAVSRWETGAAAPDIGSLMGLARIFDCTTDELLGMNAVKKEDRIKEYMNRIHEASFPGEPDGEKVIAICRDVIHLETLVVVTLIKCLQVGIYIIAHRALRNPEVE